MPCVLCCTTAIFIIIISRNISGAQAAARAISSPPEVFFTKISRQRALFSVGAQKKRGCLNTITRCLVLAPDYKAFDPNQEHLGAHIACSLGKERSGQCFLRCHLRNVVWLWWCWEQWCCCQDKESLLNERIWAGEATLI